MSVPVPLRGTGKLEVNTKAQELCVYTLKITSNAKNFPPAQDAFTQKIRDAAVEIHTLCWEANNIKVGGSEERYRARLELQARAADRCNALCAMIEIAKPLFHLPSKRATYWIGQVAEVRNQIRAWRESDMKRLKPIGDTPII